MINFISKQNTRQIVFQNEKKSKLPIIEAAENKG